MFSPGKLIVLLVVFAAVWYGAQYFRKIEALRRQLRAELDRRQQAASGTGAGNTAATVEDLVACSECGAYVPARGARACHRPTCPWPR